MLTAGVDVSQEPAGQAQPRKVKAGSEGLDVYYSGKQALFDVTLGAFENEILACIGPSGCGKSTFLRCFNRMNDEVLGCRVEGRVLVDGEDVNARGLDLADLRRRVGMVFQRPNPLPISIYENVLCGVRSHTPRDTVPYSESVRSSR